MDRFHDASDGGKEADASEFSVYSGYYRMEKKTSEYVKKRLQKVQKCCLLVLKVVIFITIKK